MLSVCTWIVPVATDRGCRRKVSSIVTCRFYEFPRDNSESKGEIVVWIS